MIYRQNFFSLIVFCLLALFCSAAQAQDHVSEAFRLAGKGDWRGALRHAEESGEPALHKLIQWRYALDVDSGASFNEISNFIIANPEWPQQSRLLVRAEQALRQRTESSEEIFDWLRKHPPITGIGKIALARTLLDQKGSEEEIRTLVREGWRQGDFDEPHEKDIVNSFRDILTAEDHEIRTDRLLWEKQTAAAHRMLNLLSKPQQRLAEARITLIKSKRLASVALSRVPDDLKDTPGLQFDRMQWRARRGDDKGVREMLLAAPSSPPYPEKWWAERETQVRMAIDEKDYSMAKELLEKRGTLSSREQADADWLDGWLHLEFLKNPSKAQTIFARMYESVGYPVSLARAAYWAGRAADAQNDRSEARSWYGNAARHPTTFYGQLAMLRLNDSARLDLPSAPSAGSSAREAFARDDRVRAINLCLSAGERKLADKLLAAIIEDGSHDQIVLAAELASQSLYPNLAVRAAKKALQNNVVMAATGYPILPMPKDIYAESALVLAVARQESEFDPEATSPSGARGLIQLMPGTARETARKLKMRYDKKSLFQPDYNLRLGSHYLSRMVENYGGSYVMAIAAYNAGPGNVRKWVKKVGTPGDKLEDAINWIEQIPFAETRNYVQRVLENLQVYRHLENDSVKLALAADMVR